MDERIVPGAILQHTQDCLGIVIQDNTRADDDLGFTIRWISWRENESTGDVIIPYYEHFFRWELIYLFTYVCHQDDAVVVPSLVVWPDKLTRCSIMGALEEEGCYLSEAHYAGYFSNRNNMFNDYRCPVSSYKKLVVMPTNITNVQIARALSKKGCLTPLSHWFAIKKNGGQLVNHWHKNEECLANYPPLLLHFCTI